MQVLTVYSLANTIVSMTPMIYLFMQVVACICGEGLQLNYSAYGHSTSSHLRLIHGSVWQLHVMKSHLGELTD
jgi:hypothetical protein